MKEGYLSLVVKVMVLLVRCRRKLEEATYDVGYVISRDT